jgi:Zn-dependent M28 family amino/carboxypeptidase
LLIINACRSNNYDFNNALKTISTGDLKEYVSVVGSDRYMGRAPFTEGETLTIEYLAGKLKEIGFDPAFNGSYFQEVPLSEISSSVSIINITKSSKKIFSFKVPDDVTVISPQLKEVIEISNSDMIFAGFGIVAPEFGWDDYEGLDVKGKTVVVLVNDPGLYTGDSSLFKGREMTYYGRWTYKYEEAARQGATGIMIIHETEGAGYGFNVPRKSAITPNFYLQSADSNRSLCQFTGWFSADAADALFDNCGYNVSKLRTEACKGGFKGFNMKTCISMTIHNNIRYNQSPNVAGILRGSENPDECIIYSAHWDHLGIGEPENGDSIYNGAVDNGSSIAWELAIGKAFSALKKKPARSIILFFPTAEEQGLLGSAYYADHPPLPIQKTVACINNDAILPIGRMKDVTIIGYGQSDLDSVTAVAAAMQDRYITPDPDVHTGMYFRSDHFSFAAKGIPSLYAKGSTDSREYGKEWASARVKDYIENRYHRPADNYDPETWNFDGMVEDAALGFTIGYKLANSKFYPKWKEGSEFKHLRE